MAIRFFSEGILFSVSYPQKTRRWINSCANREKRTIRDLNYIFCDDNFLLGVNQKYLQHDDLTDIITFQLNNDPIEGEIYISIDRVRENAKNLSIDPQDELHRVMIHGVLHMMGYRDKLPSEKAIMRKKEEACLSLRR